jgi:hypothetical protein
VYSVLQNRCLLSLGHGSESVDIKSRRPFLLDYGLNTWTIEDSQNRCSNHHFNKLLFFYNKKTKNALSVYQIKQRQNLGLNKGKRYKLIAYPTASQSKLMYTLAPPPSRTGRWLRRRCRSTTITPQVANAFATVSAVKSNFISALLFDLDCISFNLFGEFFLV